MKINLNHVANIAKKVYDEQTAEELSAIRAHFGAAYSEAKVVALICAKLLARLMEIEEVDRRAPGNIDIVINGIVERGMPLVEFYKPPVIIEGEV